MSKLAAVSPEKDETTEVERCLRKRRTQLVNEEMYDVIRVYKKCKRENEEDNMISTKNPRKRTSEYLGLGESVVGRIWAHYQKTGELLNLGQGNRTNHKTILREDSDEMTRLEAWFLEMCSKGVEPTSADAISFLNRSCDLLVHPRTMQRALRKIRIRNNLL